MNDDQKLLLLACVPLGATPFDASGVSSSLAPCKTEHDSAAEDFESHGGFKPRQFLSQAGSGWCGFPLGPFLSGVPLTKAAGLELRKMGRRGTEPAARSKCVAVAR
jgi:hypothetical protein